MRSTASWCLPKETTSMPKTRDYTLTGLHLLREGAREAYNTAHPMTEDQLRQLELLRGTGGGDADGTKARFLTLDTTTQRMPGKLDDDVIQTLQEGQALEDELRDRLAKIKKIPFSTEDPDAYRITSDDYIDMSGIDSSSYHVREQDPNDPSRMVDVYRSRYNNVTREGPRRREQTQKGMERSRLVNPNELRSTLMASRREQMSVGYEPWQAKELMSTMHREHAAYDVDEAQFTNTRDAVAPLRNRNYQLSQKHELAVTQHDERARSRNAGTFATEYTDGYQDRYDEADIDKKHAGKSVFDIKNGAYTMDHHFHHPRDATGRGETYNPAQLVPGQYTTMAKEPLHAMNFLETSEQ
ncbi:hypothetical protein STCU_09630 [Strigomonas culicis]|uniref:Uncharacterized protein n=1 Tax=Strigomonas culicis TaxID=28005 RepID=S9UX77_9TRYP|nr:hypothetical protein STCU_09630 [Strigomonas culicis]|eukprot:EPY19086.1 hypothetical protein STCU_09630 [Strigomonas culicis]